MGAKLARWLLPLVLVVLCGSAIADGTVPYQASTIYTCNAPGGFGSAQGSSAIEACTGVIPLMHQQSGCGPGGAVDYVFTLGGATAGNSNAGGFNVSATWPASPAGCGAGSNPNYGTAAWGLSTIHQCILNSTDNGTNCSCNTGYEPGDGVISNPTVCYVKTVCDAGLTYDTGWFDIGTSITAQQTAACVLGCQYSYDGGPATRTRMVSGVRHFEALGTYTSTGAKCGTGNGDPTNAPPPPAAASSPPPSTCQAGYALGSVNDQPVCAPVGTPSGSASSPATGIPDPPKATQTTSTTSVTNPDGSVTKSTVTTATGPDGSQTTTTTTTTTKADGSSTSDVTVTGAGAAASAAGGNGNAGTGGAGGNGTSAGGCSDNPSASGCGGDPAAIGSFYTAKTDTWAAAFADLKGKALATPFVSGASGFFTVSNAGACPQDSWDIAYFNTSIPFGFMCGQTAQNMLAFMKVVLAVCAGMCAFKIALL